MGIEPPEFVVLNNWKHYNTLVSFAMDHGCHEIDGDSGSHGLDMAEDINIVHLYNGYSKRGSKMRVYVIRHGESETNREKKWTGWLDARLTDKGKEDAKRSKSFLGYTSFEKVYTSDLTRAVETMKQAVPDCCYETSELLREINVGNLEGSLLNNITEEERTFCGEYGYANYGGETKEEFYDRIRLFMKKLEESDCENIAVFSHAGWLCGMLDIVLEIKIPRKQVCCRNCTVAIFEYTQGRWQMHSWVNLT